MKKSSRILLISAVSAALLGAPAAADAAAVVNGDFETGDLSGWQSENSSVDGNWFAYSGTRSPLNSMPIPPPPQGTFAAITDQGGAGRHVLYQDITLEPGHTHQLSLIVYYTSAAPLANPAPESLDPKAPSANQQYRIDVMTPSAPITSVDPTDILLTVFRTNTGDPQTLSPTPMTADLTPFAGQNVRLRFAEVDSGGPGDFQAGADAVSINSTLPPSSNSFTLGKPRLNKKNGTVKEPVIVPGPGVLTLKGKGVVTQRPAQAVASRAVTAAGTVNLLVRTKGKARKKLSSTGQAKVKVTITFTPTGGTPNSQQKTIKLRKALH